MAHRRHPSLARHPEQHVEHNPPSRPKEKPTEFYSREMLEALMRASQWRNQPAPMPLSERYVEDLEPVEGSRDEAWTHRPAAPRTSEPSRVEPPTFEPLPDRGPASVKERRTALIGASFVITVIAGVVVATIVLTS